MHNNFAKNQEEDLNVTEALRKCVSCSVIVLDGSKKITLLTPEAAALTGVKAEKALNQPVGILPKEVQEIFEQTVSSVQPVSAQIKLRHPSRGDLNILIHATPTFNSDGKVSGAVAVLNDFNCAEKLEENLARINRLASIGTLSASMAHEIKNALVAVKTFLDLLLSQNQEDELAGIVGREMTRIDSIVSQILKFSGPAKPVLLPIRLHDVLNHSLRLVQDQMAKKDLRLERSFAAAPDLVNGDDYQLKQAFLNLLFNAIEATSAHGTLSVTTELIGETSESGDALRETTPAQLRVTIRDTGVGIAPENLDRVFEPFFTTKPKGTGLGLPITRRIIHEQ